jgi:hypothetical protein
LFQDHSDEDESRKHHRSKTTDEPIEEPAIDPSFNWLDRRDYLTETFLIDNTIFRYYQYLIKNYLQIFYSYSSPADIEDFWKFVKKYQLFQQRRKQPIDKPSDSNQQRSNILNLPLIYEKKHRLNVSITINKSITHADPRYDMTGEKIVEYHRLSSVRLAEFKSIIEYYFDFNQKEKVEKAKFENNIFFFLISNSLNVFINFDKIKIIYQLQIIVEKFLKIYKIIKLF